MNEPERTKRADDPNLGKQVDHLLSKYVNNPQSPRPEEIRQMAADLLSHQNELAAEIRQRRDAQKRLEAYRDRYVDLYDFAPLGYITLDEEGYTQEINLAGARLLGGEITELVGYPLTDYVVASDRAAFLEHVRRCCNEHQDVTSELGLIAKDGRLVTAHLHSVPVRAIEHEGTFCKTAIIDVTERNRAEEQRHQFVSLAENSHEFIGMCDTQFRPFFVNEAGMRMVGLNDLEQALQTQVTEFFFPEDQAFIIGEFFPQVLRNGHGEVEIRFRHFKTGEPLWMIYAVFALTDAAGKPSGFATVSRNIGERKRAEQEKLEMERRLFDAQKLESLGVLAGGIAHDFNNILAGIMGYADLALLDLSSSKSVRADIEVIKRAAQRAADLTRQMLAFSGKGAFVIAPVDLSRVVEESQNLLAMSISKKAALTCKLADNLPLIQADTAQMCQVVMNLIINASEALGEHSGMISIATAVLWCEAEDLAGMELGQNLPPGLYVSLEVADTGCGMDEHTRAKIFDPFFTTKFTGRGLGLAAVHGIVRGHRGAIQISSEPGKGTIFRVFFPAGGREVRTVTSEPAVTCPLESGTVLVVDDEEMVRTLAQRMITYAGLSVLTAGGGREAIGLFREHQHEVNCVLLDLTMPDLDGVETLRELRRIRPDVRVILSSGYSEDDATERFTGQGLAGFIQKPYQFETLITKLREAGES